MDVRCENYTGKGNFFGLNDHKLEKGFFFLNGHKSDKVRGLSDFSRPEPYTFKVHVAFSDIHYRNEFYFCGLYRCVNSGESLTN